MLVVVLLDYPAKVAALESGFEDEYIVLSCFWDVEGKDVELQCGWLDLFSEW